MNKIVNRIIEKLQKVSDIINQPANKTKDTVSDKIKEKLTNATESTNQSLSLLSSLREFSIITSTGKKEEEQDQDLYIIPSREYLKNLELSDLIIISSMSYDFYERFKYFFEKDVFTSLDPFKDPEHYSYYLFIEKNNYSHIISMVVIRKDVSIQKNIWYKIIGKYVVMLDTSPEQAKEIKELMPKDTNNFYPFRKNGTTVGYIMFAYQICGLKNQIDEIKT